MKLTNCKVFVHGKLLSVNAEISFPDTKDLVFNTSQGAIDIETETETIFDPSSLAEGDIVEFLGGWRVRVSESIRKDVIFVELVGNYMYKHHALGLDHPLWKMAMLVN